MSLIRKVDENMISFLDGDTTVLWMKETLKDQTVEIALGGEMRSETTHAFLDELLAMVSVDMHLELDFTEVTYISAAYMKALLTVELAIEKKNRTMTLYHLPAGILETFERTGAIDLLRIE